MTGYIYALWHKDESDIFYIGSTIDHKRRFNEHFANGRRKMAKFKINYTILETLEFELPKELVEREKYWINHYIDQGKQLKNVVYNKSLKPITKKIIFKDDNLPPDVLSHIFKVQTSIKIFNNTGYVSMKDTFIHIVRDHMILTKGEFDD